MRDRYWLGRLGNEQLLVALKALVLQENELTSDLLAHLAELDERRLFLELGFSSLFAYCTESLGLSESSAGRRITAARVGRRFPGVFAAVARGELTLSILCALNPYLNQENAAELLGACGGMKRQQVEEILAARFPRPDVPESIRRLPVRAAAIEVTATAAESMLTAPVEVAPLTARAFEPGLILPAFAVEAPTTPIAPPSPSAKGRVEPLSVDRYGVHFTADGEFRDLLEAARALASHQLLAGNMAELMKLALKAFIEAAEKRRFAVGRKPRGARNNAASPAAMKRLYSPGESDSLPGPSQVDPALPLQSERTCHNREGTAPSSTSRASRHIPAAVAREVYVRDQGRCSFVSATGRRCDCRVFLEVDHAVPWALGGAPTPENLRLRCRSHNQLHAWRCFGRAHVVGATARARREAGEKLCAREDSAPHNGRNRGEALDSLRRGKDRREA